MHRPARSLTWVALVALAAAAATAPGAAPAPAAAPTPLQLERALARLDSPDWILKYQALTLLSEWKVASAAGRIRAILNGKGHPWIRGRALVALARILGPAVLDDVLKAAADPSEHLRGASVEAAGIIGSPRGRDLAAGALKDKSAGVRHRAVVAYARLHGKDAWAEVSARLRDTDAVMVRKAAEALVHVPTPEARKKLLALLAHKDKEVVRAAAEGLGKAHVSGAAADLLKCMAANSGAVRAACLRSLVGFEAKAVLAPMLTALKGEEAALHAPAMQVLGAHPSRRVCDEVIAVVGLDEPRYAAVLPALFGMCARADADRYVKFLLRHVTHTDWRVCAAAVDALRACRGVDYFDVLKPALTGAAPAVRVSALRVIAERVKGAPKGGIVAYLAGALAKADEPTARQLLGLLARRVTASEFDEAMEAVGRFLASSDTRVRAAAAGAVNRAAGDSDDRRRIAAAQGYLTEWMAIGLFPNDQANTGLDTPYPPEKEIDFTRVYEGIAFMGYGAVFTAEGAVCGTVPKKGFYIRPPTTAAGNLAGTAVTFTIALPQQESLKLVTDVGPADVADDERPPTAGQFKVRLGRHRVFARALRWPGKWRPVALDLSAHAGKTIKLTLIAGSPKNHRRGGPVAVGDPRIVAGDRTVIDLIDRAGAAVATLVFSGRATPKAAWADAPVHEADGRVWLSLAVPRTGVPKVAYALAEVDAPKAMDVLFEIAVDDRAVLLLNGKKVADLGVSEDAESEDARRKRRARDKRRRRRRGRGTPPVEIAEGTDSVPARLRKGRNRILLKLASRTGKSRSWGFAARLLGPDGRPIPALKARPLDVEEDADE